MPICCKGKVREAMQVRAGVLQIDDNYYKGARFIAVELHQTSGHHMDLCICSELCALRTYNQ